MSTQLLRCYRAVQDQQPKDVSVNVTLLNWITLSLLLVLAENVSTEPQCDANHVKLLLLVDVRDKPKLTVTRIKNIASYFVSRVKDGLINILNVCLVDPFQKKTLFNLTSVTSSLDFSTALDLINQTYVNTDDGNVEFLNNKSRLFLAFDIAYKVVINEIDEKVRDKKYVVVFLSRCLGNCEELYKFRDLRLWTNSMLKLIFLFDMPLNKEINLYNQQKQYERNNLVFINSKYDFTTYNPVIFVLCEDCKKGMTKYIWSGYWISCYWIDIMDKPISWFKAARMCQSERSSLPAIETEEELMFIGKLLQNKTYKADNLNASEQSKSKTVNVDLHKKWAFQQNGFRWSNLRRFNIEANFERSEDNREHCVAVTFRSKGINQTDEFKWKTVNCDKPITKILVCEMEEKRIDDFYKLIKESDKILDTATRRQTAKIYLMLDQINEIKNVTLNESPGLFYCHDDYGEKVIYGLVCDGENDCSNGRDEQYCQKIPPQERKKVMLCVNPNGVGKYPTRTYIHTDARCNTIQDCPDNSDEQGCDGCLGRQCEDRTCVPSHWLSRDQEKCHLYLDDNSNKYVINVSYPCTDQCSGLVLFHHEITFCDVNTVFKKSPQRKKVHVNIKNVEWAPKCLYLRGSDWSTTGCHNNRHLRDCRTFQCPEGFLKCPDSYCVPVYNFGDLHSDCPYGEDEAIPLNSIFQKIDKIFKCLKSEIFIHHVHLCDGVPQCPYGEDEAFCNMTCPPGFNCNGQAVGVANHTLVPEITSLNIFYLKAKYLNLSGVDLSKLNETFILPNLLEIHASNCNLKHLDTIFGSDIIHINTYTVNLSFNNIKELLDYGPLYYFWNLQFLNLSNNKHLFKIQQRCISSPVLHTIDLSFTQIPVLELDVFKNFKSIRSLNLFQTNIEKIGSLLKLKRLEYFNLQKTRLSQEFIIMILKEVSVSTSLYVDNYKFCCPQISGEDTPQHACHAPPEAFSSCEDLLSDVLKRSLLWLVAGVSLAGNIIVVTYRLIYDRGVFKKGYGVFVTNLSVSDCVMGVYLLIIASTDLRYRDEYVLHESDWLQSSLCQAAGFLSTLSSETSTFFVFLITLDRYLVIRFPFGDHRFTKLGLVICVLFVWIIGFILALVPLMYPEWRIYSSNGMCLGLPLTFGQHLGWHYSFGIFIGVNFIMFIFIACGQIFIFRLISSSHHFQMTNVQGVARRIQEINVAKQLFLVVLSNFLCWFPICILGFLALTGHVVSPDTYAWLVVFVMPLNAAINPMIYTIPVMYSKWRDFKRGGSSRFRRSVNKSGSTETKL